MKSVRREYYDPEYRVDFWHQLPPPPGGDAAMMGFNQAAYLLTDVRDVFEVLRWAEENADGRSFVIYTAFGGGDNRGISRVFGADPTHGP